MKTKYRIQIIILFLGIIHTVFPKQKILVIVETTCYMATSGNIDQYLSDIITYDNKKAQLIVWDNIQGTNYAQCNPLWQGLQNEYMNALDTGDILEGAVLIGNVPVPQVVSISAIPLPLDQVYMDIVDTTTNPPQPYNYTPFDVDYGGNYTITYGAAGHPAGDHFYDIWISRINAQYLYGGIRKGASFLDEYMVYNNYLEKVHNRMAGPANVPSRGFVMGAPVGWSIHNHLGCYFALLNLPWLAEFTAGDNSSFNWMSQLLAGPRGCINYGAFNGSLFPTNERNARYCRYNQISTVYAYANGSTTLLFPGPTIDSSDSLGWEWAGAYGHSMPDHTDFFSNEDGQLSNGRFSSGTVGPYWASSNYWINNGIKGGHYWYQDDTNNPNPYNRTLAYKDKKAQWRWNVPALPPGSNGYNVYVYYVDNSNNCNYVEYYLYQINLIGGVSQNLIQIVQGQYDPVNNPWQNRLQISPNCRCDPLDPQGNCIEPPNNDSSWGQQVHWNRLSNDTNSPNYNWERIFTNVNPLSPGATVELIMPANSGSHGWCPTVPVITGNRIIDAIRFISCDANGSPDFQVDDTVDDADPLSYPDPDFNNPWRIFATKGFFSEDEENRNYEDMGDELGGGGYSKSQFFLMKACQINNFISTLPSNGDPNTNGNSISKNIGNLYALGHNGLICMGATTNEGFLNDKSLYTTNLRDGKDFGEAFQTYQNAYFSTYNDTIFTALYSLLGAGSLRAQPYVQYGTYTEQPRTITDNEGTSTHAPVLVQNVNVDSTGNWTITSINDHDGSSPWGTHQEIVIRPECHFAPKGTNEVHLWAQP
jgi:hypothetical protein